MYGNIELEGFKLLEYEETILGLCAIVEHDGMYSVCSEDGRKQSNTYSTYDIARCKYVSELHRAYLHAAKSYGVSSWEEYYDLLDRLKDQRR